MFDLDRSIDRPHIESIEVVWCWFN